MTKLVDDTVLNAALNQIKNNCNQMTVCSGNPTTYLAAHATNMLANVTMAGTDFTLADGDTSGRKITVGAKSTISITNSGTAATICLIDTVNSILLFATSCTSQALVSGNTVSVPAWKDEIADPV